MNLVKLKIKAKHLATEPAIIRHEERKLTGSDRTVLQYHRIWDVRNEARATQLAIAFLKGKDLKKVEPTRSEPNNLKHIMVLDRVKAMVRKYGGKDIPSAEVSNWFHGRTV